MVFHGPLPDVIPVFPLPGALLLPRARLPLHIFEPRYLQMLEDVLKTSERLIGMVQPEDSASGIHRMGCAGRVTQFSETEDGRYMITLTGVSRYRVVKEIEGFSPYRRFEVSWEGFGRDRGAAEQDEGFDRSGFLALLGRYFDARGLSADWDTLKDAENELLINSLSMMLDFNPEDKQALLEASDLSERRAILVTLIEFALRAGASDEVMQ